MTTIEFYLGQGRVQVKSTIVTWH